MIMEAILINGKWETPENSANTFKAVNPIEKISLSPIYPVSDSSDVDRVINAGKKAADELRNISNDRLATFIEKFADNIEARAQELIDLAYLETALPKEPRLAAVELPRTVGQLRQAATATRDMSWCNATIDTKSNIRSMLGPLGGPVVVFGPNNFPYAFNSCAGGDFAAAIAAGNPVIAKANTGHPGTTKIFAECAFDAVQSTGLPKATIQLLYRVSPEDGFKLVSHPMIGATGFTGSKYAGLKLKEAADKVGKPIYLEMSSVNPVFILPGAIKERSQELAQEFYASCRMGAGQFCTSPGLIVVEENEESRTFINSVVKLFSSNKPQTLLGKNGLRDIIEGVKVLKENGAEVLAGGEKANGPGYAFEDTILEVAGSAFIENPEALQTEAFGTVALIVVAKDTEQMKTVAESMEGNLTGTFYSHTGSDDDSDYNQIAPVLRQKVGRLLNDKMPTGVAVVSSMNHGGPFPATGHPGFTAVGIPNSMVRFGALHCYDNVRAPRLPDALKDKNPTGRMMRCIDGEWMSSDVKS
jgi:NADP-dependent aldehyde dehydrogenase